MAFSPLEVNGGVGREVLRDILNNPASELSIRLEFLSGVVPSFEESVNSVSRIRDNKEGRCVEGRMLGVEARAVC